MLRDDNIARQYFRDRHRNILVDEFQDTDPLQAEIAFYLATSDTEVAHKPWYELTLDPGRLFMVGDAKQSIYRFRRADLGVLQRVLDSGYLIELQLSENRRSQKTVLEWINALFKEVMQPESGIQAEYIELQPNSGIQQHEIDSSVQVFGGPVDGSSDEVRRFQSRHIASLITGHVGDGAAQPLMVYDKFEKQVRFSQLRDVCILVRSRTGLGILERELEGAGIPHRIEGRTLLFSSQEVQDLLNCLRAIEDPADQVSVVAALRFPAFACSDQDLYDWVSEQGSLDYLRLPSDADSKLKSIASV